MITYDVEISFTTPENERMNIGATQVETEVEIKTSQDVQDVARAIGLRNGYLSVQILGIAEAVDQSHDVIDRLGVVDPDELLDSDETFDDSQLPGVGDE